jgi:hypothetical protein
MNAWSVYLIASAALVAVLIPPLAGTLQDSREGSDYRVVEGISSLLNSMQPGTTVTFSIAPWSTRDSARLGGHEVTISDGNGTLAMPSRWTLPNVTVSPGVGYQAWLTGGYVSVSAVG